MDVADEVCGIDGENQTDEHIENPRKLKAREPCVPAGAGAAGQRDALHIGDKIEIRNAHGAHQHRPHAHPNCLARKHLHQRPFAAGGVRERIDAGMFGHDLHADGGKRPHADEKSNLLGGVCPGIAHEQLPRPLDLMHRAVGILRRESEHRHAGGNRSGKVQPRRPQKRFCPCCGIRQNDQRRRKEQERGQKIRNVVDFIQVHIHRSKHGKRSQYHEHPHAAHHEDAGLRQDGLPINRRKAVPKGGMPPQMPHIAEHAAEPNQPEHKHEQAGYADQQRTIAIQHCAVRLDKAERIIIGQERKLGQDAKRRLEDDKRASRWELAS